MDEFPIQVLQLSEHTTTYIVITNITYMYLNQCDQMLELKGTPNVSKVAQIEETANLK